MISWHKGKRGVGIRHSELCTVCDGASQLQQTPEGQRGHVRLAPAVGLLLHVLLKLDPSSSLLPPHLMIILHNQLVQLHKQLQEEETHQKRKHTGNYRS